MGKDSIGSIKGRIVAMIWNQTICIKSLLSLRFAKESKAERDCFQPTSLGKSNIDVCFPLRDPGEGQGWYGAPHSKSSLNSTFHITCWQLWGIVYDPSKRESAQSVCDCLEQLSTVCVAVLWSELCTWYNDTGGGIRRETSLRGKDKHEFWASSPKSLNLRSLLHRMRP